MPGPPLFPSLLSPSSILTTPRPRHIYSSSVSVPCTVTMLSVFRPGRSRKQNSTLSKQLQPCTALTSSETPDSQSVRHTGRNTVSQWIIQHVIGAGGQFVIQGTSLLVDEAVSHWVRELVSQPVKQTASKLVTQTVSRHSGRSQPASNAISE